MHQASLGAHKIVFSASAGLPEARQQPKTFFIILLFIILSKNSPCLVSVV